MIEAAIFDLDGIIIDSEPLQMVAINQVMARWNIKLTEEEFLPMIGRRLSDDYPGLRDKYNIPMEYPEFVVLKNNCYQNIIRGPIQEMPGLSKLLDELAKKGIKRAVASGSCRVDIEMVLKGLGVFSKFREIVSGDDVKLGKPAPEIYLLAAKRLGVDPKRCVAFEDTYYGVTSAKSAGMKCIAIPHKYTAHQDFTGADRVLGSMEEVTLSLLESL